MGSRRLLEGRGTLGVLADQHAGPKGCWVNFFGRPASTHKAIAVFSLTNNAPLMVGYARRLGKPLHFEMGLEAMAEPARWMRRSEVKSLTQWFTGIWRRSSARAGTVLVGPPPLAQQSTGEETTKRRRLASPQRQARIAPVGPKNSHIQIKDENHADQPHRDTSGDSANRKFSAQHSGHSGLPDLFVVGAAKSGTTALFRYFRCHPQVFVPSAIKETNYMAFYNGLPLLAGPGDQTALAGHSISTLTIIRGCTGAVKGESRRPT